MGFFKKKTGGTKGGKRKESFPSKGNAKKAKKQAQDEEISSSEEDEIINKSVHRVEDPDSGEDFDNEQERSTREARLLLEAIKEVEGEGSEDDVPKEVVKAKKVRRNIAEHTRFVREKAPVAYRFHRFSPVCIYFSGGGKFLVSCSKDGSLVKYDVENCKKCGHLRLPKKNKAMDNYHKGEVTSCAVSPDDKYLATGGHDTFIKIWDFASLEHVKDFKAHQLPVTSLAFRKDSESLELFSASKDRSVKAWNLDQMGFVDTMYGHQDTVMQIDMLSRPRVLTCGGQDKTLRLFKVAEESQLVFNGYGESLSIDTVAMIDQEHFISGAMDGSLNVWSNVKKKPVCVVKAAHGSRNEEYCKEPYWICSVAACPYTDLVASGSCDGVLKLWKIANDYKSMTVIDEFELKGFINDIRFTDDGQKLACAVGQEHKNGRWWKVKEAKNSVVIISLRNSAE